MNLKPFSCHICLRSFARTYELRQHFKTHEKSSSMLDFKDSRSESSPNGEKPEHSPTFSPQDEASHEIRHNQSDEAPRDKEGHEPRHASHDHDHSPHGSDAASGDLEPCDGEGNAIVKRRKGCHHMSLPHKHGAGCGHQVILHEVRTPYTPSSLLSFPPPFCINVNPMGAFPPFSSFSSLLV
jgi:hypothetical protein